MNISSWLRSQRKNLREWLVLGVVIVLIVASAGTAIVYSGLLGGGQVSTSCGSGCLTEVTSTTTTTTTRTTSFPSTASTTSTVTVTSPTLTTTTTTTTTTSLPSPGNVSADRLGFWLQEADVMEHYSASGFFNAMFLTPPYPSSLEVMIFAISQAETNGQPCSSASSYISSSETYWGQVAQLADSYPNIRLVYEVAFDPSSPTYGVSCFGAVASSFAAYASVYGIGVEGEYSTKGVTTAVYQSAMAEVQSLGKKFINYYPAATLPSGALVIGHTNFPGGDAGGYDQVATLSYYTTSQYVGLDSGYYASFQFPSGVSCPIGASAMNAGTAGWNQCVVETELATAVGLPTQARQFLELDPGFDASGSFIGVSGQSTNQLWDNPTLRSWVWTDPDYVTNFILSTPS